MNREFLANEINNLSKRDKEIMMLRYGLNNTKEYTQKDSRLFLSFLHKSLTFVSLKR